jgi:two-component system sensor histidine kinase BarA
VLDRDVTSSVRTLVMHYDPSVALPVKLQGAEFVSIINTSQAIAQLVNRKTEAEPQQKSVQEAEELPRKNVLLVDDNGVNLKLASELIKLWGHVVCAVERGDKALEIYQQQRFDLIILDIQMPDIDGVSLLHLMREHKPADQTPIVALTANVLNGEAGRLIDLGFDYFLSKPIDEDKFRSLLDGNPCRQQVDSDRPDDPDSFLDCSLDYAKSLALSADNESLLRQIFEILQRDIPDQQLQLEHALAQLDQDRLAAIAHKLLGVTCYASLPRLRRKILGFQQRLAHNDNSPLDESVQKLNQELNAVKLEVDRYLEIMVAEGISV